MDPWDFLDQAGPSSSKDKFPNGSKQLEFDDIDFDYSDSDDELDCVLQGLDESFLKGFCKKASTTFFDQYGLISHQINSYNDFVKYGIQQVFDSIGEIMIEPGYDPSKKGDGEWRRASLKFGKVTLEQPTFWTSEKFSSVDGAKADLELFPRHARLQNMTYSSKIKVETHLQRRGVAKEHKWVEKPKSIGAPTSSSASGGISAGTQAVTDRLKTLSVAESKDQPSASVPSIQFGSIGLTNHVPVHEQKTFWKPKAYGTVSGPTAVEVDTAPVDQMTVSSNGTQTVSAGKPDATLSKLFSGKLLENFTVDNSTYSLAQVRATFYPKFENEKSDHEVRERMIEMVSKGLATMEVSLKHSGSLFMYAGHEGGAYAKNSYGNIYTAVGVFVLGRMFHEAWGSQASKKQAEFNDFLERNRMCISMELVTAVLGDHGQRPREDYVVVTAVTELGSGKPKFYSTPDLIAFCRKWRLPTNHVWLFSTRKSVTSFFAAFDALCEEGTATTVCKALDEVSDISAPGSKDHIKVQGEILEGLVARIVSRKSSEHMEQVIKDYPQPPLEGGNLTLSN